MVYTPANGSLGQEKGAIIRTLACSEQTKSAGVLTKTRPAARVWGSLETHSQPDDGPHQFLGDSRTSNSEQRSRPNPDI